MDGRWNTSNVVVCDIIKFKDVITHYKRKVFRKNQVSLRFHASIYVDSENVVMNCEYLVRFRVEFIRVTVNYRNYWSGV